MSKPEPQPQAEQPAPASSAGWRSGTGVRAISSSRSRSAWLSAAHAGQVDEQPRQVEQAGEPARDEDDVKGLDPEVGGTHARDYRGGPTPRAVRDRAHAPPKKGPVTRTGAASLIAVITVRHLLREEKQGTTALRLSFADDLSRGIARCDYRVTPDGTGPLAQFVPRSENRPLTACLTLPPFPPAARAACAATPSPARWCASTACRPRPDPSGVRARRRSGSRQDVASMPGVQRLSRRPAVRHGRGMPALGVPVMALFPVIDPALKTPDGREAHQPRGPGAARRARAEGALSRARPADRRGARSVHQPRPGRPARRHRLHPQRRDRRRCWRSRRWCRPRPASTSSRRAT